MSHGITVTLLAGIQLPAMRLMVLGFKWFRWDNMVAVDVHCMPDWLIAR